VPTEIAASSGNVCVSTPEKTRTAPSAPPAAPAAPRVELPTKDADYLNNPKPPYPRRSKLRGEEGTVIVRLYIDVDGSASNAEIAVSSGYVLLDRAGLQAASHWKYVPGKRDGVPVPMWGTVPVKFELTDK
jgi:protein TonB